MIRYSFFILGFLLGLLSASAAVPEEISGAVTDAASGEPIAGVVVKALGSDSKTIGFASSDAQGRFKVRPNGVADSLSFRCMGYEGTTLPATHDFSKGVRLNPAVTQLKDVIIKAPDIYAKGDTLVFNVDRFAGADDNAIIDVIKRLPGITVEDNGTIKYQGKPINKFYINGNDFIGGQYGPATENISKDDVKSVEVMENHQSVKALEGIEFPEEAGINLTLKDDARDSWVGVAKGAAGMEPLLYDGSLYAMRIASDVQNVFTLRGGNTGWNPATQITEHDFHDMFPADYRESLWPEYISADMVSAPLSEKRTRDNLSWIANAISAWKRGDNSMSLKLNYMADRLDYASSQRTGYFSESIPDFIRYDNLRTQQHDLSAQFNSEINRKELYFKDRLTVDAVWRDSKSAVTGTADLNQTVRRRSISAVNDIKLVKRSDKRLFELVSRNSFLHSPDRLRIAGTDNAEQSLGITDLRSTTATQFGKLTRFWKFYLSGGIDLNYHRINSRLQGLAAFDNAGIANAFLSDIHATPKVDYNRSNWRISMSMPVKWLHHSLNGRHDYLNISPRLSVWKNTSARSEFYGSVAWRLTSPQSYMNLPAAILADYSNLFAGTDDAGGYSDDFATSLSYRYRNPLNAFFFNASAGCNLSRSALMSNQLFIADIIVSTYAQRLSHSSLWWFNGGISKGMGHGRFVAGCDASASLSAASAMRDDAVYPYRQLTIGARPYLRGSLLQCLSINYEADYSFARMAVENRHTACHSFRHNIKTTYTPVDGLHMSVGAEHFFTRFPEGNTGNLVLLDASAVWQLNGKTRLSLTADNLLNRRHYEYVTYGTLSRTEHSFRIRPRNILASIQYRF